MLKISMFKHKLKLIETARANMKRALMIRRRIHEVCHGKFPYAFEASRLYSLFAFRQVRERLRKARIQTRVEPDRIRLQDSQSLQICCPASSSECANLPGTRFRQTLQSHSHEGCLFFLRSGINHGPFKGWPFRTR